MSIRAAALGSAILASAIALSAQQAPERPATPDEGIRFKSGIELVDVTVTVTDGDGRFVSGLRQDDFTVYEDDQPQTITQFSAERVPVSLGIALDTSGSMAGNKIDAARSALNRLLFELLEPKDEIFLYRFSDFPALLEGWTEDRAALAAALGHITPNGGTALYDTTADAVQIAAQGRHRKRALLVISDGNDTSSHTELREVRRLIRENDVIVYAIGIDGSDSGGSYLPPSSNPAWPPPPEPRIPPIPLPRGLPTPPPPTRGPRLPRPGLFRSSQIRWAPAAGGDRVNVDALRQLTDDSGGRTEIIRDARDLNPATANIAAELSRQYYLGYAFSGARDGRWHTIRVDVRGSGLHIRARRGYTAN